MNPRQHRLGLLGKETEPRPGRSAAETGEVPGTSPSSAGDGRGLAASQEVLLLQDAPSRPGAARLTAAVNRGLFVVCGFRSERVGAVGDWRVARSGDPRNGHAGMDMFFAHDGVLHVVDTDRLLIDW